MYCINVTWRKRSENGIGTGPRHKPGGRHAVEESKVGWMNSPSVPHSNSRNLPRSMTWNSNHCVSNGFLDAPCTSERWDDVNVHYKTVKTLYLSWMRVDIALVVDLFPNFDITIISASKVGYGGLGCPHTPLHDAVRPRDGPWPASAFFAGDLEYILAGNVGHPSIVRVESDNGGGNISGSHCTCRVGMQNVAREME